MDLVVEKVILVGSSVFFSGFDDFKPKDTDELHIVSRALNGNNGLFFNANGKDIFLYPNIGKEAFIEATLGSNDPIKVGKFLVNEFIEHIGLTIEDLKRLEPLFDELDDKHKYEKVIYESYVRNEAFYLTDEQRNEAYCEYKKYRA